MYEVIPITKILKEIKHYSKKDRSLLNTMREIYLLLESGNFLGNEIGKDNNDNSIYKLRIPNLSSNKGKSGGYRIIYYVVTKERVIFPLTLYSKSDRENISDKEIADIITKYIE